MTLSARRLGARGGVLSLRDPSLGRPTRPILTSLLLLGAGTVVLVLLQGSLRSAFISSIATTCICLSLVVLSGYIGQVSLAQMSFVGVSAFVLTHLAGDLGIPFPLSLLLAALAAVPLGVVIGLPALRIRGVSLAVVTLAAAAAMDALVFSNVGFTGGLAGRTVEPLTIFGYRLTTTGPDDLPRILFGVLALVIVVFVGYCVARLRTSATGRMFVAIRSNERAAAYMGIHVASVKLYAFALSAFIAGIGGGLIAYQQGSVSSSAFAVFSSLTVLALAYVAGIGRIAGAVLAGLMFAADGLFVSFLDKVLHVGQYQMIVAGVALALTAIGNPDGVASELAGEKGLARLVVRARDAVFPRLRRPQVALSVTDPVARAIRGQRP
jgi:ABC-type branched-subunit amino acid transport system permease subunit